MAKGVRWVRLKWRGILALSGMLAILCIAGTALADGTLAAVSNPDPNDNLFMRAAPDAGGTPIGLYYNGVRVEVLDAASYGIWAKVRIGTLEGYMQQQYLAFGAAMDGVLDMSPYMAIQDRQGTSAALYAQPHAEAAILARHGNGTAVKVLGVDRLWYHVTVDGQTGFIAADALVEMDGIPEAARPGGWADAPLLTLYTEIGPGMPATRVALYRVGGQVPPDMYRIEGIYMLQIWDQAAPDTLLDTLYFTSFEQVERYPDDMINLVDLNFDGYMDIDTVYSTGTSGMFHCFFLFNPATRRYEAREFGGAQLCQYTLYPQKGMIHNYIRDGAAGGTEELYRWEQGRLTLLRRAVWGAPVTTAEYDVDSMKHQVTIYDYTQMTEHEPAVLYQATEDEDMYGDLNAIWQRREETRQRILWEGYGQP